MRKLDNKFKDYGYLIYRWLNPIVDPIRLIKAISGYIVFFKDWLKYAELKGAEPIRIVNTYPCIYDKTQTTVFDSHYFYQDIWAFNKIYKSKVNHHIDVGSRVIFVGLLTAITKVTFIDIRPLVATLENFNSKRGSIISLPFEDNSVASLSCLHVVEHVGLGRYGDPLDPLGVKKGM